MDINAINNLHYRPNIIIQNNKKNYSTNAVSTNKQITQLSNCYYPNFQAKLPIIKAKVQLSNEFLDRINTSPQLADIQRYLKTFPKNKGEVFNTTVGNSKNATQSLLMLLVITTAQNENEKNILNEIINKMKRMPAIDYGQSDSNGNSFIANVLSKPNGKYFLPLIKNMVFDNDTQSDMLYLQIPKECKFMMKMYNIQFKNELSNEEFNRHINKKTYRKFDIDTTNVLRQVNASRRKEWIKLMHKKNSEGNYFYPNDFLKNFADLPLEQLNIIFDITESIPFELSIKSIETLSRLYVDKKGLQSWINLMCTEDQKDGYAYPANLPERYNDLPSEQLTIIPYIIQQTGGRLACDSEKVLSRLYKNKEKLQAWFDLINSKDSTGNYIYSSNLPGIYVNLTPEQLAIVPYIKEIETEKLICRAVGKLTNEQVRKIDYIGTKTKRKIKLKTLKLLSTLNDKQLSIATNTIAETIHPGKYIITNKMLDKCQDMTPNEVIAFLKFCKKHPKIVNIKRKLNAKSYIAFSKLNEKQLEQVIKMITEKNSNNKYIIKNDMLNNCYDMSPDEIVQFLQFCRDNVTIF